MLLWIEANQEARGKIRKRGEKNIHIDMGVL